jgi:uncharacterized protein (TIGR02117 family)
MRGTSALLALPCLYLATACVLGAIPVNASWQPPPAGITVWLTTNGVHAGLALPARAPSMDWTTFYPPHNSRSPGDAMAGDTVTIGWGDRAFFLEVPSWGDLDASIAFTALGGRDRTVMHVEYGPAPALGRDTHSIVLTQAQYERLVAFIVASTTTNVPGHAQWIAGHAYADRDAFYEANGHYSALMTCNQWVRDALSRSGVRTATWAPFDRALFWQLR